MFAIQTLVSKEWHLGKDFFWMPGPAVVAARQQSMKLKCTVRVVVYPSLEDQVIEMITYVPPTPRDVTALTKEIFG